MQYLFLVFAVVAFAVFAPLKVTLSVLVCLTAITFIVKFTAAKFLGPVSVADAARSVGWSAALLAGVGLLVLLVSGGKVQLEGLAALVLFAGLFVAFVFGFKLALNANFGASAAIAVVSTAVSVAFLYMLRPLLF
jgi:hypothetical protein